LSKFDQNLCIYLETLSLINIVITYLFIFTLGENPSNSVNMNEDSGLDKNEVLIEIVDPGPCIPVLDMDVHISDLEIVLLPEENKNSLTLKTESLGTAEAHINTSKICDSTCMVDVKPSEDFGQCNLFEGLLTIIV
jgi:hypothetical protein